MKCSARYPRYQGLLPLPPATRSQRTGQKPKLSKLSKVAPVSLKVCTAREYPLCPQTLTFVGTLQTSQGVWMDRAELHVRNAGISPQYLTGVNVLSEGRSHRGVG